MLTEKRAKKITWVLSMRIVATVLLTIALCICTGFLIISTMESDGHTFRTGEVKINLNGGAPIVESDSPMIPGETLTRAFYIENEGTSDVFYTFCFENTDSVLSDFTEVTVRDGDTVLLSGRMSALTRANAKAVGDILQPGERRDLTVTFRFVDEDGNDAAMAASLHFDFSVMAVQTKNNPDKKFD